jgi:HEAT repeat protein
LDFLALWNYLHDSLRAEANEQLNQLAWLSGMDDVARQMLKRGGLGARLIGMTTLGHLRDAASWQELQQATADADPVVSLVAAGALMRIDAERATPVLIQQIAQRADWSLAACAGLLKEAGADIISAPLIQATLHAPPTQAARLLRFFELAHATVALPAARQLLRATNELEVITGCLRLLQDPEDLELVRRALTDTRWPVRVQAASALGRLGTAADEVGLRRALEDEEWWVRYRAAQALVNLPGQSEPQAAKLLEDTQISMAGRDILRQVLAERQL